MKFAVVLLASSVIGCSADVVVPDSEGGGGAGTTSSPPAGGCDAHDDCGPGNVCIFATGSCAPSCEAGSCDSCGPGSVCNQCATGSCPECEDCVGACLPAQAVDCDDDDPCDPGLVCVFELRQCSPACSLEVPCPGEGMECDGCGSSSCCSCKNCTSACVSSGG